MSVSLRLRLAVWYAALLGLIVAATSILSYSIHSASHYDDVDRSLDSTVVHAVSSIRDAGGGHSVGSGMPLPPVAEFASTEIYLRAYDSEGRLLASSANAEGQPDADPRVVASTPWVPESGGLLGPLVHSVINAGQPPVAEDGGFVTVSSGHGRARLFALGLRSNGSIAGYVLAGASLESLDHSMDRLGVLLVAMSLLGLGAALLGGWAIARSALHPVSAMAREARTISRSRGFSRRLPPFGRQDELGQLATAFNEMLGSLEDAYRTEQRFVADASHELRAPLTAIQGNLELMQRAPELSEDERLESMAYIRKETERMSRLVADLLVLARADAGQSLSLERVELDTLLLEVFRECRVLANGRKLSVRELDQLQVEGDRDRLKQLMLILVDNAIKYTPEGGEISLALSRDGAEAIFTVSDNGIGISGEDLPHIFERFYRADKARSRDLGGSGLGLSIARWIVERHGGAIAVASEAGLGSTFTVRLPLLPH